MSESDVVVVFVAVLAGGFVSYMAISVILMSWAKGVYKELLNNPKTECDIDAHVGKKNPVSALKVVLAHKGRFGSRQAWLEPIDLECFESPHVPGLYISRRAGVSKEGKNITPISEFLSKSKKKPVIVATIRMGFGHHRLAYSAVSWALANGNPTIFHDLLNIKSAEAELLVSTDNLYSKASRFASEMGGLVEKFMGTLLLKGDADALRVASLTAAHLQPLMLAFPKDTPIITTHQLVALTAAAAGFTNVVNLVVDNHAQWFLTVPKTMNLMQGPVNYQAYLRMGITPKEVLWAGHWCPRELVQNIPKDCARRIARAKKGFGDSKDAIMPRRLLFPVGGAGAQRKFITGCVRRLAPMVKSGKVQLFLNAGDHEHMIAAFKEVLAESKLDYDTVDSSQGVKDFQANLLEPTHEPNKAVTLFAFEEYFPAVATTDILSRVADVLCCKPSELAFYCLPKLHIRRVGDHEAFSAKRSSEMGDGTVEAREFEDAMEFVDLFVSSPDLLVQMNEAVIKNNQIETYHGCKKALDIVLERAS